MVRKQITALQRDNFRLWVEKPRKWLSVYVDGETRTIMVRARRGDNRAGMSVPLMWLEAAGKQHWRSLMKCILLKIRHTMRNKKEK